MYAKQPHQARGWINHTLTVCVCACLQDHTLSVVGNEIANRGEFPGGPDGCAIDFEDSSDGVSVIGNYISHSWGAGVMIFAGTGTGNTNLLLKDNILIDDGCKQRSADHGEIAFMRGGQNGTLESNIFATCAGATVFQGDHSGFKLVSSSFLFPSLNFMSFSQQSVNAAPGKQHCEQF